MTLRNDYMIDNFIPGPNKEVDYILIRFLLIIAAICIGSAILGMIILYLYT